jgi:hypothetical protein
MKKSPTPLSSCPENVEQTARHLMIECSLFSKDRPAALHNLPPSYDNAIPHTHSRRPQTDQKHLPNAARTIKTRPDPITTPKS